MTRTKAFTAQRLPYQTRSGKLFILARGGSRSARWYVLDVSGKYLTKGAVTLLDAQIEAEGL